MKEVDNNGFWRVRNNPLSKAGVFPYLGKQISGELEPNRIYKVYRPMSEISAPETIESFDGIPLIDEHEMIGEGWTDYDDRPAGGVVYHTYAKDGKLFGDIRIFSEQLKDEIKNGKKELSMGYSCRYEPEQGVFDGEYYDFVQRDLRGNHVALVNRGRMGSDVRVYDQHITFDTLEGIGEMEAMDKDDDIEWITVNGNHVPIKKGETKGDAVNKFFSQKAKEKEQRKQEEKAQKRREGEINKSHNAIEGAKKSKENNEKAENGFKKDDNDYSYSREYEDGSVVSIHKEKEDGETYFKADVWNEKEGKMEQREYRYCSLEEAFKKANNEYEDKFSKKSDGGFDFRTKAIMERKDSLKQAEERLAKAEEEYKKNPTGFFEENLKAEKRSVERAKENLERAVKQDQKEKYGEEKDYTINHKDNEGNLTKIAEVHKEDISSNNEKDYEKFAKAHGLEVMSNKEFKDFTGKSPEQFEKAYPMKKEDIAWKKDGLGEKVTLKADNKKVIVRKNGDVRWYKDGKLLPELNQSLKEDDVENFILHGVRKGYSVDEEIPSQDGSPKESGVDCSLNQQGNDSMDKVDKRKDISEVEAMLYEAKKDPAKLTDELIKTILQKMENNSYEASEKTKADDEACEKKSEDEKSCQDGCKAKDEEEKTSEVAEKSADEEAPTEEKDEAKKEETKAEDKLSALDALPEILVRLENIENSLKGRSEPDVMFGLDETPVNLNEMDKGLKKYLGE